MAEADNEADNIALYRRLIDDGVGVGNLAVVEEVLAPDIAMPTLAPMAPPDLEGLEQVQVALRAGMPDTKVTIDDLVANGDWVAAKLTWTGTQTGEFFGIAPTGKRFTVTEIEVVRCEDGRIVECRNVFDVGALMAQLSD